MFPLTWNFNKKFNGRYIGWNFSLFHKNTHLTRFFLCNITLIINTRHFHQIHTSSTNCQKPVIRGPQTYDTSNWPLYIIHSFVCFIGTVAPINLWNVLLFHYVVNVWNYYNIYYYRLLRIQFKIPFEICIHKLMYSRFHFMCTYHKIIKKRNS